MTSARAFGGPEAIEIAGLEPGRHDVSASWSTSDGVVFGQTSIVVGSQEMQADLRIQKGFRVNGKIYIESGNDVVRPLSGAHVEFQAKLASGAYVWGTPKATSADDGTFSIGSVPAIEYAVQFSGLPPDSYLMLARQGDRDLLTENAVINGDSEIEVVVGADGGTVEGVVHDSKGLPVSGAFVALAPDSRANVRLYRTASSDQDGKFILRGVMPGAFTIFAWLNMEGPGYLNPKFLQKYEDHGKPLVVTRSKTTRLDIPVADEEGIQ
jgi:hypothetical protein